MERPARKIAAERFRLFVRMSEVRSLVPFETTDDRDRLVERCRQNHRTDIDPIVVMSVYLSRHMLVLHNSSMSRNYTFQGRSSKRLFLPPLAVKRRFRPD